MSENENYLFERIRTGDEAAFKIIYKKYAPRLYYFVYEYVTFNDVAENIIQETFMTFWEKKTTLSANTNLGAYLFTVAKNNCLYKLRDRRYQQRLFDSTDVDAVEMTANLDVLEELDTSQLAFNEIERIISQTLDQLPPQCRAVFMLSRFDDKKNREIAKELNISEKTVEGHITKALKIFRTTLKDYLPMMTFLFFR